MNKPAGTVAIIGGDIATRQDIDLAVRYGHGFRYVAGRAGPPARHERPADPP